MRALQDLELLDAAAACHGRHHIDAALVLACLADSGLDAGVAPDLRLGRRDRLLLQLRAATFGRRLDLAATCPGCGGSLTASLSTDALSVGDPDPEAAAALAELQVEEATFRLRPSTSRDLAAVVGLGDVAQARRVLAHRSLEPVDPGRPTPPPGALSEDLLDMLSARLAALDPQGDLFTELDCPACGHGWEAPIDIGLIVIREIEAAARRLLADIHDLASTYHWTEADILALPPWRRQAYLARVRE